MVIKNNYTRGRIVHKGRLYYDPFPGARRYVLYTKKGLEYIYSDRPQGSFNKRGFPVGLVLVPALVLLLSLLFFLCILTLILTGALGSAGIVVLLFLLFPMGALVLFLLIPPLKDWSISRRMIEIGQDREYREDLCHACGKVYLCDLHDACPHCGGEIPERNKRSNSQQAAEC